MANTPLRAESARDNSTDTLIEQAWQTRRAAYDRYNALPFSEDPNVAETPEERAEWAIIDQIEETIRSTVASTPRGAAIQLWTALQHTVTSRPDEAAALRRDLQHFQIEHHHDWDVRLILAALRSLEAMEADHGRA